MYCRKCGKQLSDGAKFCIHCGTQRTPHAQPQADVSKKKKMNPLKVILAIAAAAILVVYAVTGLSIPEMIQVLKGEEIRTYQALNDLELSLDERNSSITVQQSDWDKSEYSWDIAQYVLADRLNESPDRYYVDIRNTTITHVTGSSSEYRLCVAYFDELLTEQAQTRIDDAAEKILAQVPAGASDWETARIIHDALIRHVTYEENQYDQTIYGALVEGKAVCNGYAMAYEYLLEKAGIPCDTVVGYTSKLDALTASLSFAVTGSTAHAWNVVTLADENGRSYDCYVDVTWDDHDKKDIYGQDYIVYDWFGVTQEAITKEGRCEMSPVFNTADWDLDSDTMNYHVHTGSIVYDYDLDQITSIMAQQLATGTNVLTIRMADINAYHDVMFQLTEFGGMETLLGNLGLQSAAYEFTYAYDGDGIICLNMYLNYES